MRHALTDKTEFSPRLKNLKTWHSTLTSTYRPHTTQHG